MPPTSAGTVGGTDLPLVVDGPNQRIQDLVNEGLLAYLAHWLNFTMSDKLGSMAPTGVVAPFQAVPEANRFPFDPGTTFVRFGLPAIYGWCPREVTEQLTQVRQVRVAEYHVRWIFKPITIPFGRSARAGLLPDVGRTMQRAAAELNHETFPVPGTPEATLLGDPTPGQSIERLLGLQDLTLLRLQHGTIMLSPGQEATGESITRMQPNEADGGVQRGFPLTHMVWQTKEIVGPDLIDAQADETGDIILHIEASTGEGDGTIPFLDRPLEAPDGSEFPEDP